MTYDEMREAFVNRTQLALRELFEKAKAVDQVQFAMSLCPEFRGCQDPGWCTAEETKQFYDEICDYIRTEKNSPFKVRTVLCFYCHIYESSGFYECPENMMRLCEGQGYSWIPFKDLNKIHKQTGDVIAPNANAVFKTLIGHSRNIGLRSLESVFIDAFDGEIRNAFVHSDYILWSDGVRIRHRNGGHAKIIGWDQLNYVLNKGMDFYSILLDVISEYIHAYETSVERVGCLGPTDPPSRWCIKWDSSSGLSIRSTH